MIKSPISSTIDFDLDGLQHGYLKLPHSHDGSAWGSIMIPITVAKNGEGPTALLTGGNHGDEYEGPISLFNLTSEIDIDAVSGRVIIIPAMNYPAFRAAKRTSPIDAGNLNRSFPGNPQGTVTEKIADYFQRTLLPLADYVVDIHSGGKTLEFVPFCAAHVLPDKEQQSKCVAAMQAFNAPYSLMLLEVDATGMYDTAAEELGKIFISTELGGGGSANAGTVSIATKGITNLLKSAGILAGLANNEDTINLDMPDNNCFISSDTTGLLEICAELGDEVVQDQPIARIHDIERTGCEPAVYLSPMDGIFIGRHFPGLINTGDIIAVIARKGTLP